MKSNFINHLAEQIKEKYNLREEELTVVFPNKRAAFYLRSQFKKIYDQDIWLPQMLSIQEAMSQWSGIQLVDNLELMFELVAINSALYQGRESLSIFGSMAPQMANDFDEIDQYGVDANHLFSYLVDEKRLGVWQPGEQMTEKEKAYLDFFKNLKQYYDQLRERLETQGKGYYGMITRKLAGMRDEELLERTDHRKIIFAGFNAITPTEKAIIDKLYRNGVAEVVWDFDRYYVEDADNEAGWFARRYQDVPWKPYGFSSNLLNETKDIHLVGAMGNTIQAKALQSLLEVEKDKNTAVILADEKLLIPVLNAIPDDPERFPNINVSMGYPLRQTAVYDLVNAMFLLHRRGRKVKGGGWYLWPILRILDLELVKVIFTKEEIDAINEYKNKVTKQSGFIYTAKDFSDTCKSADVIEFLGLVTGEPADMTQPQQFLEGLTSLLSFIANKIHRNEKETEGLFLLNQISEIGKTINRLDGILHRYQRYVEHLDDLNLLFNIVSNNSAIKLNSSATSGLQVMGLLEARNLDFDTVYMIGVNEGVLPSGKSQSSFIPYQIRKETGLPDYREKQAVYAYHFYRQLQGAKHIHLLYNASSAEAGGEQSRFLLQLKYELCQRNPNISLSEEIFTNKTTKEPSPNALSAQKTDDVMVKLRRKLQVPETPEQLRYAMAPTSISTYLKCPFRFYLSYLMGVKDDSMDEEVQSNVIGTIVHETLKRLYHPYRNQVISKSMLEHDIIPIKDKSLDVVVHETMVQGLSDVGFNYLNKLNIDKLFDCYFNYELQATDGHTLTMVDMEKLYHASLEVNGHPYVIAGTIDRIDRYDGNIRIIDYKTGKVKQDDLIVKDGIHGPEDIPEKAMQLLIYKYLYLRTHPDTDPNNVTAFIFGLRYQKIAYELVVEKEDLKTDFLGTMEGYLRSIFQEMTDKSIPFVQKTDKQRKQCNICDLRIICLNTSVGSSLEDDH